jgi:hypothetical protein
MLLTVNNKTESGAVMTDVTTTAGEKFDRHAAVERVRQYLAEPIKLGMFKDPRGWQREHEQVIEYALRLIARRCVEALTDEQMPAALRGYLLYLLDMDSDRPLVISEIIRHRRPGKPSMELRDITVWDAVRYAAAEFDLNPTRNDATSYVECGCSIVAAALKMKEREVKRIYLRVLRSHFA